jgi:hypothetical protein
MHDPALRDIFDFEPAPQERDGDLPVRLQAAIRELAAPEGYAEPAGDGYAGTSI